jgi:tRNA pseudouridine38-40 synthase
LIYRLTLAYDGTDFEGWQRQREARTVQGVLERALLRLAGGAEVKVAGAGRTDAGVHALGQVASFELSRPWETPRLLHALNALLPEDVRGLELRPAAPGFHARRSALAKHYRYTLDIGGVQCPLRRRYAAHAPGALDVSAMRTAADAFVGRRDFAALQSSGGGVKTSVRSVTRCEARLEDSALIVDVEADGFLRKMVRSMVGGLLAVGRGAWSTAALREALEKRERRGWPAPAEARGLVLLRVVYPPEARV